MKKGSTSLSSFFIFGAIMILSMIGTSNFFELAVAVAISLFGLASGAALATVVGVLIEVPLMLMLVRFCLSTQGWFKSASV